MSRIRRWVARKLWKWNQLKCRKCGSDKENSFVRDRIDHMVCEEEIVCASCGAFKNYWAYGNYQYPITKTEQLAYDWYHFKLWIRRLFKKDEFI